MNRILLTCGLALAVSLPPQLAQNPISVVLTRKRGTGATLMVAAANATADERAAAEWKCDGVADQIQLQLAMDALPATGGSITLSSGTFVLDEGVDLTGKVHLRGQGKGTTLRASTSFSSGEGLIEGVYSGVGAPLDLVTISDLTLDGNRFGGALCAGVHLAISSKVGFQFGSPDAHITIENLLIANATGHGVHMEGSFNRAARVRGVRVWNVNGDGFRIESPDGHYTDCDTGSSEGAGFRILSANNHFATCKAWYSDEDGFDVSAVRTTLVGCTAQDNERHGFALRSGLVTLTGCHADSNSYKGGGANPDPHQGLYDGFHIASGNVSMSACFAYDKNEGGRGRNQRYGTFVDGNRPSLNLQLSHGNGSSHDNFTGGLGGILTGSGNRIFATGQDEYATP